MSISLDEFLTHQLYRTTQIAADIFSKQPELDGLTLRQFIVLCAVGASDGSTQARITAVTGIDRSTLTDLVGRLHSKGLVTRARSRSDARAYNVRLTPAGRRILAIATPIAQRVDDVLKSQLPVRLRTDLARDLRRLVIELQESSDGGLDENDA